MRIFTIQNEDYFKIHLIAENQEESSILVSMSNSVKSPIESYGEINEKETWAWFFLPIRKGMEYKSSHFGNKK